MAQKLLGAIVACLPKEENICVYPWESTRSEDQPLHPKTKDIKKMHWYGLLLELGALRIKAGKWVVNNEMEILGSKSGAFLSSIPYKVSVNMKRKVNGCNGRQYFINITVKDVKAVPSLSHPIETAILDTMRNVYSDTKKKSAEIVANKKKRIRDSFLFVSY